MLRISCDTSFSALTPCHYEKLRSLNVYATLDWRYQVGGTISLCSVKVLPFAMNYLIEDFIFSWSDSRKNTHFVFLRNFWTVLRLEKFNPDNDDRVPLRRCVHFNLVQMHFTCTIICPHGVHIVKTGQCDICVDKHLSPKNAKRNTYLFCPLRIHFAFI